MSSPDGADPPPGDPKPGDSGSTAVPRPLGPASSQSIEVVFSDPELPAVRKAQESGPIRAARRIARRAETIGEKVGDVVGESLSHLPVMPKTRRGRVLARSILVSFCLVFAWIAVIVGLQLRERRPPDLRPQAEAILIALRPPLALGDVCTRVPPPEMAKTAEEKALAEAYEQRYAAYRQHVAPVYDGSSGRFQEVVLEGTFVANMRDLHCVLGRFDEINTVISTETNRGPSGRTARVNLAAAYERGVAKGSLSFRWEDDGWKLLGFAMEVPEELIGEVTSAEARDERSRGDEPMLLGMVSTILTQWSSGEVDRVWHEAAPAFQQGIPLESFRRTEADRLQTLGKFQRILSVQSARRSASGSGTSIECVIEFANATIKGSFSFSTVDGDVYRLTSYRLVLPLPRIPT